MKRVLIYCRESRDENNIHFERIETQRDMLISYCKSENLGNIVSVIMHDNKTGTNFDRLNPIKNMILNKEIDIFLCKDCSRIGRNLLESLKFIEFLELNKIELVFLSEIYDEDIFPIKAWFNQLRVKDDSKKIKDVLHKKMLNGTLLINAPFGYIKDKNNLIIDEYAKNIIESAFSLYNEGFSKSYIANIFNEKGYKTPSLAKNENRCICYKWNARQIDTILRNIVYTGDMPYSKSEKISYKSKKIIKKDVANWIIVDNHHDAIISKETFNITQNKLSSKKKIYSKKVDENIFSSTLYCGKCGSTMYKKTRNNKTFFICKKYNNFGNEGCSSHKIYYDDLYFVIQKYIEEELKNINIEEILSKINKTVEMERDFSDDIIKYKKKLSILYDDRLDGNIPEYLYNEKKEQLLSKINELQSRLENMNDTNIKKDVVSYLLEKELTYETLNILFEKITIFEKGEYEDDFDINANGGIVFS